MNIKLEKHLDNPLRLADAPGSPGLPEIKDWDETSVKLEWTPPARDGGAPISGYIVEMRDKYSPNFVKCAEVHGPTCQATVPKLEEGNQYQFRVRAVNKAGPGEPSEETKMHTAKARYRESTPVLGQDTLLSRVRVYSNRWPFFLQSNLTSIAPT